MKVICEAILKKICMRKSCKHAKVHELKYMHFNDKTCDCVECYHKPVKCVVVFDNKNEKELDKIFDI